MELLKTFAVGLLVLLTACVAAVVFATLWTLVPKWLIVLALAFAIGWMVRL